jgi:hypothetical protein
VNVLPAAEIFRPSKCWQFQDNSLRTVKRLRLGTRVAKSSAPLPAPGIAALF